MITSNQILLISPNHGLKMIKPKKNLIFKINEERCSIDKEDVVLEYINRFKNNDDADKKYLNRTKFEWICWFWNDIWKFTPAYSLITDYKLIKHSDIINIRNNNTKLKLML